MIHHPTARRRDRRGFTLIEAAALAGVILLGAACLVGAAERSRRLSGLGGSLGNLRQIGAHTGAYAADNANLFWTFSRPAPAGGTSLQAAREQATDILRLHSGDATIPDATNAFWLPHPAFSHLVLLEYLGDALPSPLFTSPEDGVLLAWQRNPGNPCAVPGAPCPGDTDPVKLARIAYGSSYMVPTAFYAPDAATPGTQTVGTSAVAHSMYDVPGGVVLGGRSLHEISFPSQRVMVYDRVQRHFGRPLSFLAPAARVPLLFSDGSADVRRTADANAGFNPNLPSSPAPLIRYIPEYPIEPVPLSGGAFDLVQLRYQWTRSGLRGRDFGGPPVPWTP